MRINYETNPRAIVHRCTIPYGGSDKSFILSGNVRGIIEEGYDEVTWFEGEVWYPQSTGGLEVGGMDHDFQYRALKRGASTVEGVIDKMKRWCETMNLEISEQHP